jgi:hypothetical protein
MKEERYLCLLYVKLILTVIHMQITFQIQKAIGTGEKEHQVRLLSFNKVLHTLARYFHKLYCIIRAGKRRAGESPVFLPETVSKNHFLERKENRVGLNETVELLFCYSR